LPHSQGILQTTLSSFIGSFEPTLTLTLFSFSLLQF